MVSIDEARMIDAKEGIMEKRYRVTLTEIER